MNTDPILVTGATGCLGMSLCAMLLRQGYAVTGIGRNRQRGNQLAGMGGAFLQSDITVPLCLPGKRFSAIVHCAALSSPWGPYADFYNANVTGTQHVLDIAREQGCPFIHISTPSLYFDFHDKLDIAETTPLPATFASHYTSTKKLAEECVQQAAEQGVPTVILRPRGIFGPFDAGIVPRVLHIAKRGFFPLPRHKNALVDVTYVDNVAEAVLCCLRRMETARGGVFNITNGEPLQMHEMLGMLFDALGRKVRFIPVPLGLMNGVARMGETLAALPGCTFEPPITQYTLGLIACSQTLNIQQARTVLGYSPAVSVQEGLQRFAAWYRHG